MMGHRGKVRPGGQRGSGEPRHGRPSILLIDDEWAPTRGGISRFNREAATALAAAGCCTICLVESASQDDFEDARQRDVVLLTAEQTPAGANLYVPAERVIELDPNVVIGHDRITGSIASIYVRKYLRSAALVHVVHTAPSEIERYKSRLGAPRRIEERERITRSIAAHAQVVAAVGPRLTRYAEGVIGDGFGGVRVLQLDPGMSIPDGFGEHRRQVPVNRTILLLGRAGDIELKGLDIAAVAVAGVKVAHGKPGPVMLVRGPQEESECGGLHEELVRLSGLARDRIDVRAFTSNVDQVGHDLRRSVLSVMPSRAEGFGLVALEALGVGTPVLVSDQSGAAETLRHHLGEFASPMIVKTVDKPERDVAEWTSAMQRVLDDLPAAFDYTHEVRNKLASVLSWDAMAEALIARLGYSTS